jgi:hypothetical protein
MSRKYRQLLPEHRQLVRIRSHQDSASDRAPLYLGGLCLLCHYVVLGRKYCDHEGFSRFRK